MVEQLRLLHFYYKRPLPLQKFYDTNSKNIVVGKTKLLFQSKADSLFPSQKLSKPYSTSITYVVSKIGCLFSYYFSRNRN